MNRVRPSRPVSFRMPGEVFERLEQIAFAELQRDEGEGAMTSDVNVSDFIRRILEDSVTRRESSFKGGADALALQFRQARIAELKQDIAALGVEPTVTQQ